MLTVTLQTEAKFVEVSTSDVDDNCQWSDILPVFMRVLKAADYCFDLNDVLTVANERTGEVHESPAI